MIAITSMRDARLAAIRIGLGTDAAVAFIEYQARLVDPDAFVLLDACRHVADTLGLPVELVIDLGAAGSDALCELTKIGE